MKLDTTKIFSVNSLLVTPDAVYGIRLYDERFNRFESDIAYILDDYYYLYRGDLSEANGTTKPGIYWDSNQGKPVLFHPTTEEEKKEYEYEGKVSTLDTNEIVSMINNKEAIIVNIPESGKVFLPTVNKDDDILKRLVKEALIRKGIDIDQYKDRFVDKNALFNFKQVIRGPKRLSMLLFDRGMEALNLRYTVIIEDMDPKHPIGAPLEDSLMAASDDTYEL